MKLPDHRRLFHQFAVELPLFFNGFQIIIFHLMIGGNFFIASAISAQRLAKRKMDVQRNTIGVVLLMETFNKQGLPFVCSHLLIPERNCWITCITGHRLIVLPNQYWVYNTFHNNTKIFLCCSLKHDVCYLKIDIGQK